MLVDMRKPTSIRTRPRSIKIRYSHAMTFLLAQYENNIAITIRVMLQSMSGMEILFNVLMNRLHKTIVEIPYQDPGVKNNFIVIKATIKKILLAGGMASSSSHSQGRHDVND